MEEHEFDRLLRTSRLRLTSEEKARVKTDIDEILEYFSEIGRIAAKEEPAYQPIEVPTRFRKDSVRKFGDQEALKKGSKLHNRYIIGPKL